MNVLLLGVGMQGKAALHDLVHSEGIGRSVAADCDLPALRQFASRKMKADTVVRYAGAFREAALGYMDDMHRISNGPDPSKLRAARHWRTMRGTCI